MPSLQICRGHHASCAIGSKVYAIGGAGENWDSIQSIEVLNTLDLDAGWYLVNVPHLANKTHIAIRVLPNFEHNEIIIFQGT